MHKSNTTSSEGTDVNSKLMYSNVDSLSSEQVIKRYSELVKRIAFHLLARLPKNVLVDDLIQAGMIGLLEAARNYDATKGASFETYAGIRIRGTILDEVRRNDWVPRSVYRNARLLSNAIHAIENRTGRDAKPKEVADELGITLDEYHKMLNDSNNGKLVDLDDMENAEETIANQVCEDGKTLLDGFSDASFREFLAKTIDTLPERERMILSLYYIQELNLKEIGSVIGISESRVSQLHAQSMLRLRARVRDWA